MRRASLDIMFYHQTDAFDADLARMYVLHEISKLSDSE